MSVAAAARARLRGLYATDDPRLDWLPERPDVAEAQLRIDGSCEVAAGYAGGRFPELDVFVERCAAHAAARGCADHRGAWDRWLAATGTGVLGAGVRLGAERGRLRVHLRGHYDPAAVGRAFAAVGCEASPRLIANALALFGVQTAETLALELDDQRAGAAIQLAIPSRGGEHAAALGEAIGFLVSALQPPGRAHERWRAIAADLLATAREERVHVSLDPTPALGWLELEVGARPLALAGVIARRLGLASDALIAVAAAREMTSPRIGLRFAGESAALAIHGRLG